MNGIHEVRGSIPLISTQDTDEKGRESGPFHFRVSPRCHILRCAGVLERSLRLTMRQLFVDGSLPQLSILRICGVRRLVRRTGHRSWRRPRALLA